MQHKPGFQLLLAEPQNTNNLKQRMKTNPRPPIALLLLGTFLLAWAGTAAATDYFVDSVTVTVSSLNTPMPPTSCSITAPHRPSRLPGMWHLARMRQT